MLGLFCFGLVFLRLICVLHQSKAVCPGEVFRARIWSYHSVDIDTCTTGHWATCSTFGSGPTLSGTLNWAPPDVSTCLNFWVVPCFSYFLVTVFAWHLEDLSWRPVLYFWEESDMLRLLFAVWSYLLFCKIPLFFPNQLFLSPLAQVVVHACMRI